MTERVDRKTETCRVKMGPGFLSFSKTTFDKFGV